MQITVEQALACMTYGSAHLGGREHEIGAMAPEYFADFVVWRGDPLAFNDKLQSLGKIGTGDTEGIAKALGVENVTSEEALLQSFATCPPRLEVINDFIESFRPKITVVRGKIVFSNA